MDHSFYLYTAPFQQLFLSLLAGFITWRLWKLQRSAPITILAVLLGLSALGCLMQAILGFIGLFTNQLHPHDVPSPRRLILVVSTWLSPFANILLLTALTVLVCRSTRNGGNGGDGGVLTREERYGTRRDQAPSRPS